VEWTEGRAGTVPGAVATGRGVERASHKTTRSLPLPVPYRFIQILVGRAYRKG